MCLLDSEDELDQLLIVLLPIVFILVFFLCLSVLKSLFHIQVQDECALLLEKTSRSPWKTLAGTWPEHVERPRIPSLLLHQQGNARAAPLKAEAMHAMEVELHLVEERAMKLPESD